MSSTAKGKAALEASEQKLKKLQQEVQDYHYKERLASLDPLARKLVPPIRPASASSALIRSTSVHPAIHNVEASTSGALVPSTSSYLAEKERDRAVLIECQKELKKYRETLQQQYKLQQQHLRLEYQRLILENDRRRQEERKLLMKEIEFRNAMRTDILVMTLSTVLPGFKLKEICGMVTGSALFRPYDQEDDFDEFQRPWQAMREKAYADMLSHTKALQANCVVEFRWTSRNISHEVTEILCSGTAIKIEPVGKEKGGKGDSKGKQQQQGAKNKGKGNAKGGSDELGMLGALRGWNMGTPTDSTATSSKGDDEDEEEDSDEDEDENEGGKKNKGKQKADGKNGGGKNSKMTPLEQLVAALMHSKAQQEKRDKAEQQAREFMSVLQNHFAKYNNSSTFSWLDQINPKSNNSNNTGSNKNTNDGWGSSGTQNNSDGWGSSNTAATSNGAWGSTNAASNAANQGQGDNWGTDDKEAPSEQHKKAPGGEEGSSAKVQKKAAPNNDIAGGKNAKKGAKGSQNASKAASPNTWGESKGAAAGSTQTGTGGEAAWGTEAGAGQDQGQGGEGGGDWPQAGGYQTTDNDDGWS